LNTPTVDGFASPSSTSVPSQLKANTFCPREANTISSCGSASMFPTAAVDQTDSLR
jgi:hypothetical protein